MDGPLCWVGGGPHLPHVCIYQHHGCFDGLQIIGTMQLMHREVLHEGTVVAHLVLDLLQACRGSEGGGGVRGCYNTQYTGITMVGLWLTTLHVTNALVQCLGLTVSSQSIFVK